MILFFTRKDFDFALHLGLNPNMLEDRKPTPMY